MKPQRIFSVVLASILFASIVTLPFMARAQQPRDHFRGDTGVNTLVCNVHCQVTRHTSAREGL
jgi:hypothetical protein